MGGALCPEVSNTTPDLRGIPAGASVARRDPIEEQKPKRPANAANKEDFSFIKVVGQGSYGKVFLVQHKKNLKHFAMKVIKKELVFRTCQDEGIKGK